MSETITINRNDYNKLLRDSNLLRALRECGVDNWEGYSEAVHIAFPTEEERDSAEDI